ncbi:exodeoxyribonuclease VII large subunit [Methanoculleus taiwanensis]|uniref:Exodeoxyribonuclease VII large subunit n=1 Tax=Methanoculleus taiwanensis TaxID=1550565 RepID=A0A498H6H4_9EURY|nr:exodeoxyribonuclease VII large subunit [Methanoculleus taiwanensis]RXE57246.1 exodeoxyribonuclease VII large subunit [Methanoculleus taiwanensis]
MDCSGNVGHPDLHGTPILRVSEVSGMICTLLEDSRLQHIWVRGEVTNYKNHGSGHRYFSLGEQNGRGNAVINCAMWRTNARRLDFEPQNGMDVLVLGSVEVYEPHGKYQLIVRDILPAGRGEKHLLIEEWKTELAREGLFAEEKKRPLPRFPSRVGVVTSPTGAALQDIVTIISRRFPVEIVLSPATVQGEAAHREIAQAIRRIDGLVDVLIVGRGGGSFEDLFPFNHPDVVRAVAGCTTPVISAVGHEVDTALCDFAADVRAPTPSGAAERAVPDRQELLKEAEGLAGRMQSHLLRRLAEKRREVEDLRARMHPARLGRRINERMQRLTEQEEHLRRAVTVRMERNRLHLAELRARIESRSHVAILRQGYCIAAKDGRVVRSVRELAPEDRITLCMQDGRSRVIVEDLDYDE